MVLKTMFDVCSGRSGTPTAVNIISRREKLVLDDMMPLSIRYELPKMAELINQNVLTN
jgi:hypothetical protein